MKKEKNFLIGKQDKKRELGLRRAGRGAAVLLGLCLTVFWAGLLSGCGGKEKAPESVRVGSLKGPTSMGILFLMEEAQKGECENDYEFQMAVAADELLPLLAKGELDIALIPANVAAAFYAKTDGSVKVIDINTLGVLYIVTGSGEIGGVQDLRGRTVYLTGKGATPEAALKYVLEHSGLEEGDYRLEYKSEAAELAALLAENPDAVALMPQPFATAALRGNGSLRLAVDLNEEWTKAQGDDGGIVTGVTVVNGEFLREHEEQVRIFLKEHAESAAAVRENVSAGAALAVKAGIVADESVAEAAIPLCNLTCMTGEEMRDALSKYLKTLADFNPQLVGGSLPGEDFYYIFGE